MFRDWMKSTKMGNIRLIGPDSEVWRGDYSDRVALKQCILCFGIWYTSAMVPLPHRTSFSGQFTYPNSLIS